MYIYIFAEKAQWSSRKGKPNGGTQAPTSTNNLPIESTRENYYAILSSVHRRPSTRECTEEVPHDMQCQIPVKRRMHNPEEKGDIHKRVMTPV